MVLYSTPATPAGADEAVGAGFSKLGERCEFGWLWIFIVYNVFVLL